MELFTQPLVQKTYPKARSWGGHRGRGRNQQRGER